MATFFDNRPILKSFTFENYLTVWQQAPMAAWLLNTVIMTVLATVTVQRHGRQGVQASWTDLLRPLIYLRNSATFTVPRGLKALIDRFGSTANGTGKSSRQPV